MPKTVYDRLSAIASERAPGTTLAAVLSDLLDRHEADRLAYMEVVAAAEDAGAMARAQKRANRAVDLLRERAASK
ncbi:hypothetical protein GCM10009850_009840 [Nonomuraea monospora]|uniref:Uncharacterized protein n=1 Tax=Nonomuraea monospora TaxID=568818 RepID=A0ABN3C834_9ACTN